MKVFKSIFLIINYKTLVVTLLSVIATWLCGYYNIQADFPLTLIGIAIVFPVVFSIDSAYKRREKALGELGSFKAHMLAIYHASRDWINPLDNQQFPQQVKTHLIQIYNELRLFFTTDPKDAKLVEKQLFDKISRLSQHLQQFREYNLPSGEISRVSQYISKLTVAVENLKVILYYRTPITLRAYSKIFIYSFPVLYAPYFVFASGGYSDGLEYMMPIIFSFILVSLDNIQDHLENPFDQVGEDDIKFDVEDFSYMMEDADGGAEVATNDTNE